MAFSIFCMGIYMKQLGHFETLKMMPKMDINCVLYICNISSINLGLILRSADIFGASAIYYLQGEHTANNKQLSKLSRNASVPVYYEDKPSSIYKLKEDGYHIISLEITDESIPLRTLAFRQKACLVIGNEQNGIPDEILSISDCSCHIEMIGDHISSLNVSIAASIES